MLEFADLLKEVHPGLFVHSIYIEENLDADQRAGFVSQSYSFFSLRCRNTNQTSSQLPRIECLVWKCRRTIRTRR